MRRIEPVVTHLFGTSNFICSLTHPHLLFSGLEPLFLLFILLFSRPILLNLTRGAWRLNRTVFTGWLNQPVPGHHFRSFFHKTNRGLTLGCCSMTLKLKLTLTMYWVEMTINLLSVKLPLTFVRI